MTAAAVPFSSEFARVGELPIRTWTEEQILWVVDVMTQRLCFTGQERLLPAQAVALYECAHLRGLFAPLVVSAGKTGISLLAPYVMGARRPLILSTPTALEGSQNAAKKWRAHWAVPTFLKFESYNTLSRATNKTFLDDYQPDLIVMDECHKLRNRKIGVTRVVQNYLRSHTECMVVAMSGTITKDSVKDYAHIAEWTSRFSGHMPLPRSYGDLEAWAGVLDAEKSYGQKARPQIGAFAHWITPEDELDSGGDPYVQAQRAYRRRLNSTPGILRMGDSRDGVDASLTIRTIEIPHDPPEVVDHVKNLRNSWTRPDGWKLAEASQVWYTVRCMALGFFLRLKVPPPDGYMDARATWSELARDFIAKGHATTEGDAAMQLVETEEWQAWAAFRAVYKPETEAVWFSGHALEFVAAWMKKNGTFRLDSGEPHCSIVWVEQPDFGYALSQITGSPFYRHNGRDAEGSFVENHDPASGPAICSIKSCGTGLNLQGANRMASSRALFVSTSGGAQGVEQPIARQHRRGQRADSVDQFFLLTCNESLRALDKALEESRYEKNTVGNEFKILYADTLIAAPSRYNAMWASTNK